ncbi:MAG: SpoIIE family protein phosphatase [Terriglobales bacterium]
MPASPRPISSAGAAPHTVRATIGGLERILPLDPLPFTIGRRSTHALAIPLPQVSRDHAQIVADGTGFALLDQGSTHGTLLNGARVNQRHRLAPGDTIEIPNCPGVRVIFDPPQETASLFLSQMQRLDDSTETNEFDRLRLLLDFGQRLYAAGGLEDILAAMLDAALRLTGAERGFVFLRPEQDGELHLATGRTAAGATVSDDRTISHSIVARAARSAAPFIMNDSRQAAGADLARSIVEQELRTVVAIPLREGMGVLYLDSHAASPALGKVSREMLDLLANDAAQVVLNAQLARRQEESRLAARTLERELALAAAIQQGLIGAELPQLGYAQLDGLSQACLQIGGDFFDAVIPAAGAGVALVLADVSGKGAAAALLAASLQGLVHAELEAGMALAGIAARANRFICQRLQGEKYATLVIVRLEPDGELEYVNCGHLPPLVAGAAGVRALAEGNMPVGLIPTAEFASARARLAPGDRLVLVTDGVTEAANLAEEMFGDTRLEACLRRGLAAAAIAAEVRSFCQGAALTDDLTLIEARYTPTADPAAP